VLVFVLVLVLAPGPANENASRPAASAAEPHSSASRRTRLTRHFRTLRIRCAPPLVAFVAVIDEHRRTHRPQVKTRGDTIYRANMVSSQN
jgi:hypothetical protein